MSNPKSIPAIGALGIGLVFHSCSTDSTNSPTNNDPELSHIPNLIAYVDYLLSYRVSAIDEDRDELTFSDDTPLFDINPSTGLISFTPSYGNVGSYHVGISVEDGNDGQDFRTFTLDIISISPPLAGKIVFTSVREGEAEIYIMNADGTNPTNLTNNPFNGDFDPELTRNGSRIVFSRRYYNEDSTTNYEIFTINPDGSNEHQLTHSADFSERYPTWSPDGSMIAFTKCYRNEHDDYVTQIHTISADGNNEMNISGSNIDNSYPSWSPDGTRIAFGRTPPQGSGSIFTMYPNGSNVEQVTEDFPWQGMPSWSPDGSFIAYNGTSENGFTDIFVIPAGGGEPTNVTNNPEFSEYFPAWNPTGDKIIFEGYDYNIGSGELHVIDLGNGTRYNITNNPSSTDTWPSWGPE